MKKRKERKRRPSFDEVVASRRFPRSDVEMWVDGHIKIGELCERLGFAGQHATFFRNEVRRSVTNIVIGMNGCMERYLASVSKKKAIDD